MTRLRKKLRDAVRHLIDNENDKEVIDFYAGALETLFKEQLKRELRKRGIKE